MDKNPVLGRNALVSVAIAFLVVTSGCAAFSGSDGTPTSEQPDTTATNTVTPTSSQDNQQVWYESVLPSTEALPAEYTPLATRNSSNESSQYAFREYHYVGSATSDYPNRVTVYVKQFDSNDAAEAEFDDVIADTRQRYGVDGRTVTVENDRTGTQFVAETRDGIYFTVTVSVVDSSVVLVLGEDSEAYRADVLTDIAGQTTAAIS